VVMSNPPSLSTPFRDQIANLHRIPIFGKFGEKSKGLSYEQAERNRPIHMSFPPSYRVEIKAAGLFNTSRDG
jgi:hypothetical protein